MNPDDDLPKDWWSVNQVLTYLESEGAPITRATWYSYVHRKEAPAPERVFGRSPAWLPATIRNWQQNRPRKNPPRAAS